MIKNGFNELPCPFRGRNKERKTDRKKEKRREEKVRRNVAVIKNLTNNNFKEQKV